MGGCRDADCGSFTFQVDGVIEKTKDHAAKSGLPLLKGAMASLPLPPATADLGYGALGLGRDAEKARLVLVRQGEGRPDFNPMSGDIAACLDAGPVVAFDSPRSRIGRTRQPRKGTYDTSWVKWVVENAPWAATPARLLVGDLAGVLTAVPNVVKRIRRARGLDADEQVRFASLPPGDPPENGTILRPHSSMYDRTGMEHLPEEAVHDARLLEAADRVRKEITAHTKTPGFAALTERHQGRVLLGLEAQVEADLERTRNDVREGMGVPMTIQLWFYCDGPAQYVHHLTSWDA